MKIMATNESQRLMLSLWHLHETIAARVGLRLKQEQNTTLREYLLLTFVEQGINRTSEIARTLNLPGYATSRMIEPLWRTGLLERTVEASDARIFNLSLSPAGEKHLRQAERVVFGELGALLERFEPERRQAFLVMLEELTQYAREVA